jgi:hypothetical protein
MAQTSHKARIAIDVGVVDPNARFLTTVIVIRPMINGYLTLHDADAVEKCTPENLVYKIDSGWPFASASRARKGGKGGRAKPIEWDSTVGDTNTTGMSRVLNIPLDNGLTCAAIGPNGEFFAVYTRSA